MTKSRSEATVELSVDGIVEGNGTSSSLWNRRTAACGSYSTRGRLRRAVLPAEQRWTVRAVCLTCAAAVCCCADLQTAVLGPPPLHTTPGGRVHGDGTKEHERGVAVASHGELPLDAGQHHQLLATADSSEAPSGSPTAAAFTTDRLSMQQ